MSRAHVPRGRSPESPRGNPPSAGGPSRAPALQGFARSAHGAIDAARCDRRASKRPTRSPSRRSATRTIPPRRIAVIVNGTPRASPMRCSPPSTRSSRRATSSFAQHREGADIAKIVLDRGYGTVLTGGGDGTVHQRGEQHRALARERGVEDAPLRAAAPRHRQLAGVGGRCSSAKGRGLAADVQSCRGDAGARPLRLVEVEGILAPFWRLRLDCQRAGDYHKVRDAFASCRCRDRGPAACCRTRCGDDHDDARIPGQARAARARHQPSAATPSRSVRAADAWSAPIPAAR